MYSPYPHHDEGGSYGQTVGQGDIPSEMTTSELFDSVMYAASRGDLPLLRRIVHEASTVWSQHGSELLNMRDENGWGPLHEAIRANHIESVQYLVTMGASIDDHSGSEQDQDGRTTMSASEFAALFLPESEEILRYLDGIVPDTSPPPEL